MRVGGLKQIISIQRRVQVGRTPIGEPNWIWQDWLPGIFAEVSVRRGKEQWDPQTKQRYSEEVYHFRVRFEEVVGVDDTMTILHEDSIYKIRAILPDVQNRRDAIIEAVLQDGVVGANPLLPAIEEAINIGVVGLPYDGFTLSAIGGIAPYAFSATGLPLGLSINSGTGAVTGTPTASGVSTVAIAITDAAGTVASIPVFEIEIEDP